MTTPEYPEDFSVIEIWGFYRWVHEYTKDGKHTQQEAKKLARVEVEKRRVEQAKEYDIRETEHD